MKRRKTYGILIGNANSPHTMKLLEGIQDAAKRTNVNLITLVNVQSDSVYVETGEAAAQEISIPVFETIEHTRMDGLILSYGTIANFITEDARRVLLDRVRKFPHVILESEEAGTEGTTIVSDNYRGIQTMTEHLIRRHDRKNLTFITGPAENEDSRVRTKAFFDTLRAHNLPCEEDRAVTGDFTPWVEPQVYTLLKRYPELDAIVCANDQMAITVEKVLKREKRKAGTEISVTGYDDREICSFADPPLSSITQNSYMMGHEAVLSLNRLLEGGEKEKLYIPAEPVLRQSCGCDYSAKIGEDAGRLVFSYEEQLYNFRQQTWQLTDISRNMMKHMETDASFYEAAMRQFGGLGCSRSFLYLFDEAESSSDGIGEFSGEGRLWLAAEQKREMVLTYFDCPKQMLDPEKGFSDLVSDQEAYQFCVFNIASEDLQYGYLVLEIRADQIALFHAISLEIANSIRFYSLTKTQRKIQKDMEQLLVELNHKNEIMSFISEYDSLTGVRNRRGFMEQVIAFSEAHPGKEATLLYADLDHLKGINDIFGHNEGDFAISQAARFLKETLKPDSIIGRIGGDEFVAFFASADQADPEQVIRALKDRQNRFNTTSDKGYYVELSMGYTRFNCLPGLSISTYLGLADQQLYTAKKSRRSNVCKGDWQMLRTRQSDPLPTMEQLLTTIDLTSQTMDDYMFAYDYEQDFFYISSSAAERFALPGNAFHSIRSEYKKFVYPEDYPVFNTEIEAMFSAGQSAYNSQLRWMSRKGDPIWINSRGVVVRDENGAARYMIGCVNEIGSPQKADNLSGLLRENSLQELLKNYSGKKMQGYAICFDIDDMRGINSRVGVERGNMVLQVTAECIQCEMKEGQLLYRLSGDEFILLDFGDKNIDCAVAQYQAIRRRIDQYMLDSFYEFVFSVSGGILDLEHLDEQPYASLIKYTEYMIIEAKQSGNSACVVFDPVAYDAHIRRRILGKELRGSITGGFEGFYAHYQAIMNGSGNVVGAEALMRFKSALYGPVSPAEFIPILEETGLIIHAGKWIMKEALDMCKSAQEYIADFKISINISAIQVQKSEIAEDILQEIAIRDLKPSSVIAELTESQYLENNDQLQHFWKTLREGGVQVALDDFGTGYSNFQYLYELRPNIIKIDHSFTSIAMQDAFEYELLHNMTEMAENLNLNVCIEGIETEEAQKVMLKLTPAYSQGFLYGRPCSRNMFVERYLSQFKYKH